ncbi:hypothetical protein EVAR_50029_1 [Eumeta japonica]|uniref:Uncharacterized protein n=1 Tax=Eumeta variegata TaxID=151549 RepID=A0A4C1YT48_EUMVA|nr:hypothetical protein EVAR_50029_1 [Eumeta japonica]
MLTDATTLSAMVTLRTLGIETKEIPEMLLAKCESNPFGIRTSGSCRRGRFRRARSKVYKMLKGKVNGTGRHWPRSQSGDGSTVKRVGLELNGTELDSVNEKIDQ